MNPRTAPGLHDGPLPFGGGIANLAALELVTFQATAPGAGFTAMTAQTGNSATVRNADLSLPVALLQCWADFQAAGTVRIRSPRLHDNVQGIRLDVLAGELFPLLPWGFAQGLVPQDTLTVEAIGSAVAGDIESFCGLVYYSDLPGINAQFARHDEISGRVRHIVTVENTLALGTGGGYTGEEALDAEFDLLRANTLYALLGYLVDAECAAIRYRGSDTGNLGVGGPGETTLRHLTKEWFVVLSQVYGLPLIPVFNAANKSGILLDGVQDENGTDVTVTTILAELY